MIELAPSAGSTALSLLRALLLTLAVMAGLVVVGVGVLFAGCMLLRR